jgi:hypothetical protein
MAASFADPPADTPTLVGEALTEAAAFSVCAETGSALRAISATVAIPVEVNLILVIDILIVS